MVLPAADGMIFPGKLVQLQGKGAGRFKLISEFFSDFQCRAKRCRQLFQGIFQLSGGWSFRVGEGHSVHTLELEGLHEHYRIGAVAAGDAENVGNTLVHTDAVDTLYPAAAVKGKAGPFGDSDEFCRVGGTYEYVVEVDRLIAGGHQDFYRDGG